MIPVTHGGHLCYIDTAGQIVLKTPYSYGEPFHCGRAIVHEGGKTFVIDRTGEMVFETRWRDIKPFHEGLAAVEVETELQLGDALTLTRSGQRGFIDSSGKVVVPLQYLDVEPFSEGRAVVCLEYTMKPNEIADGHELPSDRKYGTIDARGRVIVGPVYSIIQQYSEGLAAASTGIPLVPIWVGAFDNRNVVWRTAGSSRGGRL